jgi:proteasome assembly chaperone (PAC2) family protein
MSELRVSFRPTLRRPVLVAAFRGWNDGGQGASLGGAYLAKQWDATRFAEIDPEGFYDFQATRPQVSLVDGITRRLDWPENAFFHASIPDTDRDVILLLGVEPNLRWKTFTGLVLELAKDLDVELLVTLGSLLADVPHTRSAPVTGAATDPALVAELGVEPSRYEGPTGIVGVFGDACSQAGLAAVSFWAQVPHYVAQPPCPKATLALVRRIEEFLDVTVPLGDLPEAARAWERGVDRLAEEDSEVAEYVRSLEEREDETELPEASGDAIAAEFERYLRRRDHGPGAH